MSNIFSKFFVSFGFNKKNKYLPAPNEDEIFATGLNSAEYTIKPYKTLASFELKLQEPEYKGAIPDATIKFYPLD